MPTAWDLAATPPLALCLAALAIVDVRTARIPDALTLPLIAGGLFLAGLRSGGIPVSHLIGALAGYGFFALMGGVFFRLRRDEGLGLGDAKLLGATGAWLGWTWLPMAVLLASLTALGFALLRPGPRRGVAFGPWLALAFLACWGAFLAEGAA